MKRLSSNVVTSLLVLAVTAHVVPAVANPVAAQPQCGDEKKGDKGDDKKDDKSEPKPKPPSLG